MHRVPRVAHRSPPCIFFCDAFCKVQLILRSCGSGVAELEAWSGCPAHRERVYFSEG